MIAGMPKAVKSNVLPGGVLAYPTEAPKVQKADGESLPSWRTPAPMLVKMTN
jgi:hypothetical protein